jgi:hypothetical protein
MPSTSSTLPKQKQRTAAAVTSGLADGSIVPTDKPKDVEL